MGQITSSGCARKDWVTQDKVECDPDISYTATRIDLIVFMNNSAEQHLSRVVRKPAFCIYAKTKKQISFAVTAKLISAFVFATQIVQSLYYLNPKFQASSHLLWLHRPVCVGPGR